MQTSYNEYEKYKDIQEQATRFISQLHNKKLDDDTADLMIRLISMVKTKDFDLLATKADLKELELVTKNDLKELELSTKGDIHALEIKLITELAKQRNILYIVGILIAGATNAQAILGYIKELL